MSGARMLSTHWAWPSSSLRSSFLSTLAPIARPTSTSAGAVTGHLRDRADDVLVAGAAAEVALERVPDLRLGRVRVLGQQAHGGQHHPGGAVAALERVVRVEALLERVEDAVLGQPLDRRDLVAVGLNAEHACTT